MSSADAEDLVARLSGGLSPADRAAFHKAAENAQSPPRPSSAPCGIGGMAYWMATRLQAHCENKAEFFLQFVYETYLPKVRWRTSRTRATRVSDYSPATSSCASSACGAISAFLLACFHTPNYSGSNS
jgi:hypothetical protein